MALTRQRFLSILSLSLSLILVILVNITISHAAPISHNSSNAKENNHPRRLSVLTDRWNGVLVTAFISLPWAIIAVFDAIDACYRNTPSVALRLTLATCFLSVAYTFGLLFVVALVQETMDEKNSGRYDEIATIVVLLMFNLWHVSRNVRGWAQLIAIQKIRPVFIYMQIQFANTFPLINEDDDHALNSLKFFSINSPNRFTNDKTISNTNCTFFLRLFCTTNHSQNVNFPRLQRSRQNACIQGLDRLRISNRLIDNDLHTQTPFLNPFFRLQPASIPALPTKDEEAWAIATWRAWWTQLTDVTGMGRTPTTPTPLRPPDLTAPSFKCDKRYPDVEDLLSTNPSGLAVGAPPVHDQQTNETITTKISWAKALLTYGGEEGQQDTHGDALPAVASIFDATGIALLVHEKTSQVPHKMSGLWYNTARFEEVYDERAFDSSMRRERPFIMFPKWGSWLQIAREISSIHCAPIQSDQSINLLAGELASSSLILVRYAEKYAQLVRQIHEDGRNARWTFGWSGLLACFSHLWTEDRIFIVMLNGLSLLALTLTRDISDIDPNVRAMLYGYASFAVSDRAVGRRIAEDRKAELVRRYSLNKGKTCRGSGLCATRLACRALGLPAEASHMDGLPAFCTGWAGEFLERKPGNQEPEHGKNHDEVEDKQGSSNAWRYPYTHT